MYGITAISSTDSFNVSMFGTRKTAPAQGKETATLQAGDRYIPGTGKEAEGAYNLKPSRRQMTQEEAQQVAALKERDREVRQHEMTHAAILGKDAIGAPHYSYQSGPDGKAYAVGGYVKVDMGSTGSASENTAKSLRIRRAAASVDGMSSSDMAVALSAAKGQRISMTA